MTVIPSLPIATESLRNAGRNFGTKRQPTYRQALFRHALVLNAIAGNDEALRAEIRESGQLEKDLRRDRAYCANMQCMKPWKKGEDNPLKACAGCKYTMYCSVSVLESVRIVTYICATACQKAEFGDSIRTTHARACWGDGRKRWYMEPDWFSQRNYLC